MMGSSNDSWVRFVSAIITADIYLYPDGWPDVWKGRATADPEGLWGLNAKYDIALSMSLSRLQSGIT